jgi:hypothetical protein
MPRIEKSAIILRGDVLQDDILQTALPFRGLEKRALIFGEE